MHRFTKWPQLPRRHRHLFRSFYVYVWLLQDKKRKKTIALLYQWHKLDGASSWKGLLCIPQMRKRLGRGPSGLIFAESFQTVSGGAAAVSWPCRTPTYPSDHLLSTGQAVAMTSLSEASPNVLITSLSLSLSLSRSHTHTHTHRNAGADVRTFIVS